MVLAHLCKPVRRSGLTYMDFVRGWLRPDARLALQN
jgi:hypothetical protein